MSMHEVLFRDEISAGSSFGPMFKTIISETPTGKEERIPLYERGRHRVEINLNTQTVDDLYSVKEFAMLRHGSTFGFKIRDRSDYSSSATGRPASDQNGTDATVLDQNLGTGDGVETTFQLVKRYSDGTAPNVVRPITRPRSGTVLVAVDGVLKTEGVDYSIDYVTGQIVFNIAVGNGLLVTAGFLFDVPVRFDQSVEAFLGISITDFDNGNLPTLGAIEIIDEIAGVSDFFPGGSNTFDFSVNTQISIAGGRIKVANATTTSLKLILPSWEGLPLGVDYFVIIAPTGSSSFTIEDQAKATVVTIAADEIWRISLIVDSVGNRSWVAD